MLTLTENAGSIIHALTNQDETPDISALRISADAQADGLAIAPVGDAEPGDQVVQEHGATVYLDEGAAVLLDDKVLDAAVDQEGQVEFGLAQQA